MTRMFVVLCALTLAGCGAAKIDSPANARAEYQKSVGDEYRACINDNLKNVEKCQAKRALLEINERPPQQCGYWERPTRQHHRDRPADHHRHGEHSSR
jgi:hypothetical protein